jgi:Nucleotidyl transferase AbiEii toxin, Type IV TA system
MSPELWQALLPVLEVLEDLGVPFHLGGSVASSLTGISRATQDVDLVADLRDQQAMPLVAALQGRYYIDLERVREGIRARRSFNLIDLSTAYKIDVFVAENTEFAQENRRRRIFLEIAEVGRSIPVASPEDIVLHKLLWFEAGGRVSDRQWYDLQGVLRLQGPKLDLGYLRSWAAPLGIETLLNRALDEAGLT